MHTYLWPVRRDGATESAGARLGLAEFILDRRILESA